MINPLYEKFPEYVVIDGKKYRIITDFREYIKLLELLRDEQIETSDKYYLIMQWFLDIPKASFKKCLDALANFMTMESEQEESTEDNEGKAESKKQVLSYTQDAPFILSGFLECYGIDLQQVDYMHWWKFQILIEGMNEDCELKKRMSYRSIDVSQIKDKAERDRIKRIQMQIAITENKIGDEDIGNAFGNMMW